MHFVALQSQIGLCAAVAVALVGVFVIAGVLTLWVRRANWVRVLVFVSGAAVATLAAQKSGTDSDSAGSARRLSGLQGQPEDGGVADEGGLATNVFEGLRFERIVSSSNGCDVAAAWTTNEVFDTLSVLRSMSLDPLVFEPVVNFPVAAGVTNLSFSLDRSLFGLNMPTQLFLSLWGLLWNGDDDEDGLPNGWELSHGLNPRSSVGVDGPRGDLDGDGVVNAVEHDLGTDPSSADSDSDGIGDGEERGCIRRLEEFHWVDLTTAQPVYGYLGPGGLTGYSGTCCFGDYPEGTVVAGNRISRYLAFENLYVGLYAAADYFGVVFPEYGDLSDSASSNASLVVAPGWKPFRCQPGNTNSFIRAGLDAQTGAMAFEFHDVKLWGTDDGMTCQVIVPPGTGDVVRISYLSSDFWMDGSHGEVVGIQNKSLAANDGYYNLAWDFPVYGPILQHTTYEYHLGIGTNPLLADTDGDGIDDRSERDLYGTDPLNADSDGDGLDDGEEINLWHTDPLSSDSDGDGLPDSWEVESGLSPVSSTGLDGWNGDADDDGLVNGLEFLYGANPRCVDSDGDGLTDGEEVCVYGCNPSAFDTDDDGMNDGWEVAHGMDPTEAGGSDGASADNDGDGLSNFEEFAYGTDPADAHTFSESVGDSLYVAYGMSELASVDAVEVSVSVGDPSGSHSERWKVVLREDAPLGRRFQVACSDYGQVKTATVALESGRHYIGTVEHLGSVGLVSDYDWQAQIDGLPTTDVMSEERAHWYSIADKLIMVDNSSGLLGACDEGFGDVDLADDKHFDLYTVKVTPTNVKFNWDTSNSSFDAVNIRRNREESYDISEGEYTTTHSFPACYVKGTRPVIKAKFVVEPASVESMQLGAVLQGDMLSDIVARDVSFNQGMSDYVSFPLADPVSSAVGLSTTNLFHWQVSQLNGESLTQPRRVAVTGPHKTYVILAEPVEPWDNTWSNDNTSMAWSDALDIACSNGWAAGATAWVGVASGVTRGIYECGAFKYDYQGYGRSHFTWKEVQLLQVKRFVRLTEAIHRINNQPESPCNVNCTDCASFVTSFANLLGCSLYSSQMRNLTGYGFRTNPYMAIGYSTWEPHWGEWAFSYHEVAWSGACGDSDLVFDACLCVDGDSDPENEPRIRQCPAGMMFSDGSPLAPLVYREKLTPNNSDGYYSCSSDSSKIIRRGLR